MKIQTTQTKVGFTWRETSAAGGEVQSQGHRPTGKKMSSIQRTVVQLVGTANGGHGLTRGRTHKAGSGKEHIKRVCPPITRKTRDAHRAVGLCKSLGQRRTGEDGRGNTTRLCNLRTSRASVISADEGGVSQKKKRSQRRNVKSKPRAAPLGK